MDINGVVRDGDQDIIESRPPKQTARKSTGGRAPSGPLFGKAAGPRPTVQPKLKQTPMLPATDQLPDEECCLGELREASSNIESRFVSTGAIKTPICITCGGNGGDIHHCEVLWAVTKSVAGTVSFPMSLSQCQGSALQPLLTAAKPSPFGRGNETVHDSTVRTAEQLLPNDFSTNFGS